MDADSLAALYKLRFSEEQRERKQAIWRTLCEDYLQRFVHTTDTVADIACGHGEFINNIGAGHKIAVDLNPDARDYLAEEVEFHQGDAAAIGSLIGGRADVLFTSNFLEHLPDKQALNRFLDEVMLALKPGGRYLILGPNLRYLQGAYWDFYDHHLGLTHLSLCEALQLKGFNIRLCVDRFLPYTTKGALPTHPLLVKAYLKFPPAWRVLGRQFFIVAVKPGQP